MCSRVCQHGSVQVDSWYQWASGAQLADIHESHLSDTARALSAPTSSLFDQYQPHSSSGRDLSFTVKNLEVDFLVFRFPGLMLSHVIVVVASCAGTYGTF